VCGDVSYVYVAALAMCMLLHEGGVWCCIWGAGVGHVQVADEACRSSWWWCCH